MAIQALNTIKKWFQTGLKPSQNQFWDTWDSFRHKLEKVPLEDIEELESILNAKAEKSELDEHKNDNTAHSELFAAKEDKSQKGIALGYAPLDKFSKIAYQYLEIVDNLTSGGTTSMLSAEQGVILQNQIDSIKTLLSSDNPELNTFQKIADIIKQIQMSLDTILVNDLTTGGATKALTAEMGKLLQANKVDKSQKGVAGGYVPLNDLAKIASQYLTIINDLTTGGSESILSAEQGIVLQNQIDSINTLIASDNVDLDTIQEIVDAIEQVQMSLDTILVNDLTTGGITKALTAEMGKLLAAIKEDKSQKGVAGGYVPLDEFSKIDYKYLNIIDNLTSGGKTSLLSAEQGVILQKQIDDINVSSSESQDLQQILDNGNQANFDNGTSQISLATGSINNRSTSITSGNVTGTNKSTLKVNNDLIELTNKSSDPIQGKISISKTNNSKPSLTYNKIISGTNWQTELTFADFNSYGCNNKFLIPAKEYNGVFTLATTEELELNAILAKNNTISWGGELKFEGTYDYTNMLPSSTSSMSDSTLKFTFQDFEVGGSATCEINSNFIKVFSTLNGSASIPVEIYSGVISFGGLYNGRSSINLKPLFPWGGGTANKTLFLPYVNGTVAVSVNGISPDSEGNISLNIPRIFSDNTIYGQTQTTLNTTYSQAKLGDRVHCMNIPSGKKIYERTDAGWVEIPFSIIS